MDKLTALRVFCTIHECGSFVGAAERLGISNAMVSKHINALEQQLQTRLIQRTTRRLTLTEAGQDYARRAVQILAQLEEADAMAGQQSVAASGTLRLAAPLSFGMRYLGQWLAELRARQPLLNVELELSDRHVDLVEEGFDLALRISTRPLAGGVVARQLGSIGMVLCASPSYLAAHGRPDTPQALGQHACLRYHQGQTQDMWLFRQHGETVPVAVDGPLCANNGDVLVNAAVAGMGIIYQPRFLLEAQLQRGELQALLPDSACMQAEVYAVYPARRYLPMKVRVLIELLQEMLAPAAAGAGTTPAPLP